MSDSAREPSTGPPATGRVVAFLRENRPLFVHWTVFLGILAGLVALDEWAGYWTNQRFSEITARWTASTLNLLGYYAKANGTHVTCNICRYHIIGECTAYFPCAVYAAAVAAYPVRYRWRALGIALGLPLLLVVNQVRLVSLCFIQRSYKEHFESLHILVWQSLFIFIAVALWIIWLSTLGRLDERRPS